MLLSNTRYTEITGQAAPANYQALQGQVVARLESALNRLLVSQERTERVTAAYDGLAYPKAIPITAVQGDLPFDDTAVQVGRPAGYAVSPGPFNQAAEISVGGYAAGEITYTGGYTPETLPEGLAQAIAWGVSTLSAAQASNGVAVGTVPPGVSSLNIAGEYSVTFAPGHTAGADGYPLPDRWTHLADLGGRCVTNALRYRRVPA
jgi:hypothetical protein